MTSVPTTVRGRETWTETNLLSSAHALFHHIQWEELSEGWADTHILLSWTSQASEAWVQCPPLFINKPVYRTQLHKVWINRFHGRSHSTTIKPLLLPQVLCCWYVEVLLNLHQIYKGHFKSILQMTSNKQTSWVLQRVKRKRWRQAYLTWIRGCKVF